MTQEMTPTEAHFQRAFKEACDRRAAAARAEREITTEIAALCVDARAKNIAMAKIAEFVKVLDPKTDELRSVTRQAVDQLVASYENRPRAPRRRSKRSRGDAAKPSGVVMNVFQ